MVVGLGNPGAEYFNTRHNVGFRVIDALAEALGIEVKKKKFGGVFGQGEYGNKKLILLKPCRFMNRSGQVVATAAGFYKLELADLLVVSDDMAIEPGRIRLRTKGSSGGQKGLDDIIVKLGSNEFNRLRIGIGPSGQQQGYDYVLGKPSPEENDLIDDAIERAKQAVICWIVNGIDIAMNEYNRDVVD